MIYFRKNRKIFSIFFYYTQAVSSAPKESEKKFQIHNFTQWKQRTRKEDKENLHCLSRSRQRTRPPMEVASVPC